MTAPGKPARQLSYETRVKISKALRGKPLSDQHRENIAAGVRRVADARRARLAKAEGESG
jgi:hypothetical protein